MDFFQCDKFWRQLRPFKLCALSNHPYFYADCNIHQLLSKKWKVSKTFRRIATWEDCRDKCNNFEACDQFNFKVCTEQFWEIYLNFFKNMKLVSPIIEEEDLYHLEKGLHNTSEIGQWFKKLWERRYYWHQFSKLVKFVWYFLVVYLCI